MVTTSMMMVIMFMLFLFDGDGDSGDHTSDPLPVPSATAGSAWYGWASALAAADVPGAAAGPKVDVVGGVAEITDSTCVSLNRVSSGAVGVEEVRPSMAACTVCRRASSAGVAATTGSRPADTGSDTSMWLEGFRASTCCS